MNNILIHHLSPVIKGEWTNYTKDYTKQHMKDSQQMLTEQIISFWYCQGVW
jgi:hypothetical protein